MEEPKKNNTLMWAVVVVVIALIGYGGYKYSQNKEANSFDDTKVVPPSAVLDDEPNPGLDGRPQTGDTQSSTSFKDGTYTAFGDYISPGGKEQIKVTVTLKNEVITGATVVSLATRPEAKKNQAKFISGYEALVIGKKITDVVLTKVSGSSLTPKGWNDAIAEIETQARA